MFSCISVPIRFLYNNSQRAACFEFVKKLPTTPTGSGGYSNGVYPHRPLQPCIDNRRLLGMDGLRQCLPPKFGIGPCKKGEFMAAA